MSEDAIANAVVMKQCVPFFFDLQSRTLAYCSFCKFHLKLSLSDRDLLG